MSELPGTWREPHREMGIPRSVAVKEWSEAAIPILEEVASVYGGYIRYKDLAEMLQDRTGLRTTTLLVNWIGKPLEGVIRYCLERDLPALSALVVHATDGRVGEGFNEFLTKTGRDPVIDPLELEWVAAKERLKCYEIWCPDLPVGAEAKLTREYEEKTRPREAKAPRPRAVCQSCGILLPNTGQCDDCA